MPGVPSGTSRRATQTPTSQAPGRCTLEGELARTIRAIDRIQERLAVAVLGLTRGAVVAPCDGAEVAALLSQAGLLDVRVEDAGAGYLHGFELVSGRRERAKAMA